LHHQDDDAIIKLKDSYFEVHALHSALSCL